MRGFWFRLVFILIRAKSLGMERYSFEGAEPMAGLVKSV